MSSRLEHNLDETRCIISLESHIRIFIRIIILITCSCCDSFPSLTPNHWWYFKWHFKYTVLRFNTGVKWEVYMLYGISVEFYRLNSVDSWGNTPNQKNSPRMWLTAWLCVLPCWHSLLTQVNGHKCTISCKKRAESVPV